MTDQDWDAGFAQSLTVFLNGGAITEADRRGQPIRDDSFLLLFNASPRELKFTLPPARYGGGVADGAGHRAVHRAVRGWHRGQGGEPGPGARPFPAGPSPRVTSRAGSASY